MKEKNRELQYLRRLIYLDVSEAATHIADVSARTWHRWEEGTRKVPADILNKTQDIVDQYVDFVMDGEESNPLCQYFDSFDLFHKETGAGVIEWRLAQAVSAGKYAKEEFGLIYD